MTAPASTVKPSTAGMASARASRPGTVTDSGPVAAVVAPVANALEDVADAVTGEKPNGQGAVMMQAVVFEEVGSPLSVGAGADGSTPVHCWVHYYTEFGIILTIIYASIVIIRRLWDARSLDEDEQQLLHGRSATSSAGASTPTAPPLPRTPKAAPQHAQS